MSLRVAFASLLIVLGFTGTAAAQTYFLGAGSGAQLQIGGGLPLPIQLTDAASDGMVDWGSSEMISAPPFGGTMGTMGLVAGGAAKFPPLLIPPVGGATVMGTLAMTMGQKLSIPAAIMVKAPAQKTLGVFAQNPALYAVGLNLGAKWPAAAATFKQRLSTMTAGGGTVMFFPTNMTTVFMATKLTRMITVQNPGMSTIMKAPFGGPAAFLATPKGTGGVNPTLTVSVWLKLGLSPPCVGCMAGLLAARPAMTGAIGAKYFASVPTMGTPPMAPNRYTFAAGSMPPGTIIGSPMATATMALPTNMAVSIGFPWTTGMLAVRAPGAMGTPEHYFLDGSDMRNNVGGGQISLVSGSLSTRTASGPNANRGWVHLVLLPTNKVPSISHWGLAALTGLLLAMALVAARRGRRGEAAA